MHDLFPRLKFAAVWTEAVILAIIHIDDASDFVFLDTRSGALYRSAGIRLPHHLAVFI